MFYVAQLAYGCFHQADLEDGRDYFSDQFEDYYADFGGLITEDVWKEYYSLDFLLQPATARFWRPPNLRDLPSSTEPTGSPRDDRPVGSWTRLPRWADTVVATYFRQQTIPESTITQIAIDTLRDTISRQREHAEMPPYSETQVRYWLKYMRQILPFTTGPSYFGIFVAQGGYNMWEWERHYTPERWHAPSSVEALEPDLDGTARSDHVDWCGWPDDGAGSLATQRGWVYELGSEEEVQFMAAVASKETEQCRDMDALDYSVRSHIILAVLHRNLLPKSECEEFDKKMRRGILEKGRLDESTIDAWIKNVVGVLEPYTLEKRVALATIDERTALLRRILAENGQLFARGGWKFSKRGPTRGFKFDLQLSIEACRKK